MPRSISFVMIARDAEATIARCLVSVQDIVDEMIVCDTGSVDRTVEIAERCGARVVRFEWIDDFAAARNAALAAASGDWRLMLDADEWLMNGAGAVAALRDQVPDFVGYLHVCSQLGGVASGVTTDMMIARVIPHGVGFVGRIHEQVDSELPGRVLPVFAGHDGYILDSDQLAAKSTRNRHLLEVALREASNEDDRRYYRFNLGKELLVQGLAAAAADEFASAWSPTLARAPWGTNLATHWLRALIASGALQEALDVSIILTETLPASAELRYHQAKVLVEAGNHDLDIRPEAWRAAFAVLQECISLGDDAPGVVTTSGYGTFLPTRLMARILERSGQAQEATRLDDLADGMQHRAASELFSAVR